MSIRKKTCSLFVLSILTLMPCPCFAYGESYYNLAISADGGGQGGGMSYTVPKTSSAGASISIGVNPFTKPSWISRVHVKVEYPVGGYTSVSVSYKTKTETYTASLDSYQSLLSNQGCAPDTTVGYIVSVEAEPNTTGAERSFRITIYFMGLPDVYTFTQPASAESSEIYTVTYMPGANGTGSPTTDTKSQNAALTLKGAVFTRNGYEQTGWATSEGGSKAYDLSASYTANADATLYPFWTAISYEVSYNYNGGTKGADNPPTAKYGTAFHVSAPTKAGSTFAGWTVTSGLNTGTAKWGTTANPSTSISSSSTKCVNGASGNVYFLNLRSTSGSVTLKANWTAAPSVTLATAVDNASLSFTTGGDAKWSGQTKTTQDNVDAAQSGTISNGQSTWMKTTVSGAGSVSFWWKVSSEETCDCLEFLVDGEQKAVISGTDGDWEKVSISVSGSGDHVLTWNYRKDMSLSAGSDCGWVDQIAWTAASSVSYSISYNYNGGTKGANNPPTAKFGTAFYVSAPTKANCTFAGWTVASGLDTGTAKWGRTSNPSTSIAGSSTKCVNGASGNVYFLNLRSTSGSVTLKANWTAAPASTLATAVDNTSLSFTTGGDAQWSVQTKTTHDNVDAAQSGTISNEQSTWMKTTVSGPGNVSFWWKVSCEEACDCLEFLVDGEQKAIISGTYGDWEQVSISVSGSGDHVLAWNYRKDISVSAGSDCGWVDQIAWTGGGAQMVWRFYSDATQGHFFTISESEKDKLVATSKTWQFEGGAYRAYTSPVEGTVPLYRFWSDKMRGHFFTVSESEKESLRTKSKVWAYEGVTYYVYPKEVSGSVAVYRFWSDAVQHHFYTVSAAERDSLRKGKTWKYEGIAFWALPREAAGETGGGEEPETELQTVWRFYSDATRGHFFTISAAEKEKLRTTSKTWQFEGAAYRAFTGAAEGTVPLHRFWSDQIQGHFFTISESEKDHLIATSKTWKYEGIAYHVYPAEVSGSVAVYRFWSDAVQHHFYTVSASERDSLRKGKTWAYEGIAFWALPQSQAKGVSKVLPKATSEQRETGNSIGKKSVAHRGVAVTTSDGSDGSAVADGDGETGWAPEGGGLAWVILSLPEPVEVASVEVSGENLPEGMRVLLSEDAEEWFEGEGGTARYMWVAWEGEGVVVREIRVENGE